MQACVEMSDCISVTDQLTTRWSGPGMRQQKQVEIRVRFSVDALEETIPGRSARSRYVAKIVIRDYSV